MSKTLLKSYKVENSVDVAVLGELPPVQVLVGSRAKLKKVSETGL